MSQDTERLVAALEKVFDDPPPPTSVDAARLLERGHRLLRRRRATSVVSAVATVVVAAVVIAAPGPGTHPAPPGATGDGTSLLNPARFGWLPKAPDAFDYMVDKNVSIVTAEWADEPSGEGPQLTLFAADRNQTLPSVTPVEPQTFSPGDRPTRVGTIDGNPVWYYAYSAKLPSGPVHDFLAWKTASGYWAALQDPLVDGPTLLHIATSADTTPTPLKVPLMPVGDLAKLTAYSVLLVQTLDNSGVEFTIDGWLGAENVGITGIAGDTGITRQNGTKCDFVMITGLGSYQKACLKEDMAPIENLPFTAPVGASASTTPETVPPRSSTPTGATGTPTAPDTDLYASIGPPPTPWESAFKVLDGIDVYVSVSVDEQYSQSLSDKALTGITSFGTNPANWQPEDIGA